MRRLLLALSVCVVLAATACGDDGGTADATTTTVAGTTTSPTVASTTGSPTTTSPTGTDATTTTTEAAAVTAADLAAPGPHPVGVTTRELPTGNQVEIWYPAGPDGVGATDTHRVRDFLPEVMRVLVPEDTDDTFTVAAGRDATPAEDGPFPLVLFSHGASSFRLQSTALAHHLASWGMVVASADHPARELRNLVGGPEDPQPAEDDVRAMWALVVDDAVLGPVVDADRVAMSGHSAGGGTTLRVAADDGIAGYVSYASGAFTDTDLPDVPSLFMAGALDTIVEPSRTRAAFEAAPDPSWYLEFADAGHLVFSDLCAVGGGDATLIDLARAAGLGDFLDEGLERLGTDGCLPPNRPVQEVWPGIHQATTGFYRWIFGIDPEPVGIDAPAVDGVVAEAHTG